MPIILDTFADYLANPGVGAHLAALMIESARLFRDRQTGMAPNPDRPCFQIGRLVHMAVLEPLRYAATVRSRGPINEKTGKAFGRDTKAWMDWQADNPDVIVPEPWLPLAIERMPAEVRECLRGTRREVSMYAEANGIAVKGRADALADGLIYDLKTIADIGDIDRDIAKHGYWFQAGWYAVVHELACGGIAPAFEFIFMETAAPHRWRIVPMDADAMDYATDKARDVMAQIANRTAADDWIDDAPIRRPWLMPEWLLSEPTITAEGISL